jgi:hypothetical protein
VIHIDFEAMEEISYPIYLPLIVRGGSGTPNVAPYVPHTPNPADAATAQSVATVLSWSGGDPDGDTVTYDVYLEAGSSSLDMPVSVGQSSTSYNPSTLLPGTLYYWRIIATDSHGASSSGPIWSFTTTTANAAPNVPSSPSPMDGATDQSMNVDLSWTGGDPDGDSVVYTVYLEVDDSTPDVAVPRGRLAHLMIPVR